LKKKAEAAEEAKHKMEEERKAKLVLMKEAKRAQQKAI
jgi:hypothetical protein